MEQVYLDYNASTPVAPEVRDAMVPLLDTHYGNPSCGHWAGKPARLAVQGAREQVAGLLGCAAEEVIFTSGGSEANNHAIIGSWLALQEHGNHIITSTVEHPAVVEPLRFLERTHGAQVSWLPVDGYGRLDPDAVREAIRPETILITVMHANNEVGTLQPIAELGSIARERGIRLHTDAAQSLGKVDFSVDELGVDLLAVAGHKLYAPKGVGALYIRKGTDLARYMHGAGHEFGQRAGTESAFLVTGLGKACELAAKADAARAEMLRLRDWFWDAQREVFGDAIRLNGHPTERLPNTLNVSYRDFVGADLLISMPWVAASTGSACHADQIELSPVLQAMRIRPEWGKGAVRWSLGRGTTQAQLEQVVAALRERAAAGVGRS